MIGMRSWMDAGSLGWRVMTAKLRTISPPSPSDDPDRGQSSARAKARPGHGTGPIPHLW
jgi:hypothetical protein